MSFVSVYMIVFFGKVPKGRVDHSLLSAADYLPTIASIAGAQIPANTTLNGLDVSDILCVLNSFFYTVVIEVCR